MSKHRDRKNRRYARLENFHAQLDAELAALAQPADEKAFIDRIIATFDEEGTDGRTFNGEKIRANFGRYIESRRKTNPWATIACMNLLERAIAQIRVRPRWTPARRAA